MAYPQTSGRLPFESASKTGHLPLMSDPLIRRLVQGFQIPQYSYSGRDAIPLCWNRFSPGQTEIRKVISCDGSYQETRLDSCDLVYIRVGVQRLGLDLTPGLLHPFQMQEEIRRNSECIQTVLPAEIPCYSQQDFSRKMREAIFATVASHPGLLTTFRWIFTEGWTGPKPLPAIQCPRCGGYLFLDSADSCTCTCGEPVYITDILGWDKDLGGKASHVEVAARFMLVLEFLFLMTCIRQMWTEAPEQLPGTLFLHDGPLSIGGRYTQLIVPLRHFFRYAQETGNPVLLCGVEKTGYYVNHFLSLGHSQSQTGHYFTVPSHAYIQQEIEGRPITAAHRYGDRHLLGERVFVRLPEGRQYVLTVPSSLEDNLPDRPVPEDLIGLNEILNVLPKLVTPVYDNALFPIARVNNLVSMASEPAGHMLELFSDTLLWERRDETADD